MERGAWKNPLKNGNLFRLDPRRRIPTVSSNAEEQKALELFWIQAI